MSSMKRSGVFRPTLMLITDLIHILYLEQLGHYLLYACLLLTAPLWLTYLALASLVDLVRIFRQERRIRPSDPACGPILITGQSRTQMAHDGVWLLYSRYPPVRSLVELLLKYSVYIADVS